MTKLLSACLLTLTLAACAVQQPPGLQRTADNQVPPARIYIKEMAIAKADLAEVQFTRISTLLNGSAPLELSINDVVLAQVLSGEHMSIWLKPGTSYTFSVKPVYTLNSATYPPTRYVTVEIKERAVYKVRISADVKGATLQQDN